LRKATTTTSNSAEPVDDGRCFACGSDNPIGLHLRFRIEGETAVCETALLPAFQGWRGVAHGGIVMALIDEAMAYAASAVGWKGVTAECTTRFRRPVPLGAALRVKGTVTWQRRNVVGVAAEIFDADGTLLASGEGKFVGKARIEPGTLGVLRDV
jgi:uncharacterized protein (TIGR00369 family)